MSGSETVRLGTVATADEVEALPVGTVIEDAWGAPCWRDTTTWRRRLPDGSTVVSHRPYLPAVLRYQPDTPQVALPAWATARTCVTVECSSCRQSPDVLDDDGPEHYADVDAARSALVTSGAGWLERLDQLLCPSCAVARLTRPTPGECRICGLTADDLPDDVDTTSLFEDDDHGHTLCQGCTQTLHRRICACTTEAACPDGCHWVTGAEDLCSACDHWDDR